VNKNNNHHHCPAAVVAGFVVKIALLSLLTTISITTYAAYSKPATKTVPNIYEQDPMYVGAAIGYGSTNWNALKAQDVSSETSVPQNVHHDSGVVWGVQLGYEITRYFALEAQYRQFRDTKIMLSDTSDYWPITSFNTQTWTANLIGKFMIPIGIPRTRAFASAGAVYVHRRDVQINKDPFGEGIPTQRLANKGHVGPTFGVGINYLITRHFMAELAFEYDTGYGKTQEETLKSFVPFVYNVTLNVNYRFGL